jgi:hypothetical protein
MMRIVATATPNDGGPPPMNSDEYYFAVQELFPHIAEANDVVGRLVFLAIHAAALRLEAHRNRST